MARFNWEGRNRMQRAGNYGNYSKTIKPYDFVAQKSKKRKSRKKRKSIPNIYDSLYESSIRYLMKNLRYNWKEAKEYYKVMPPDMRLLLKQEAGKSVRTMPSSIAPRKSKKR